MYKTKEIAALVGIHSNTVRIYEDWGFISPVPRQKNGYRNYSEVHLFQLRVARILFRCEIVQGGIRKKAREIIYASGKEHFHLAQQLTKQHIEHLQREHEHAVSTIKVVEKWLREEVVVQAAFYTRKEVAQILDITAEAVRNWERNGLITVTRKSNGHRIYGEKELQQLRVIRSLRGAHYSISAILRLLQQIHISNEEIITILNTPSEEEYIVTVTDQLVKSYEQAIADAKEALTLFQEIK